MISIAQPMACRPRLGQQKAFNNTAYEIPFNSTALPDPVY